MSWIQTYSNKKFCFVSPTSDMVDIHDVAYALSNICRYNGHTLPFYSVAEHSFHVAAWVFEKTGDPTLAMQGLLHDAHEAYIGDVTTPLKRLLGPSYREIEHAVWRAVSEKFDVPFETHPIVKEADLRILQNERKDLLGPTPEPWSDHIESASPLESVKIIGWSATRARSRFMGAFGYLEIRRLHPRRS